MDKSPVNKNLDNNSDLYSNSNSKESFQQEIKLYGENTLFLRDAQFVSLNFDTQIKKIFITTEDREFFTDLVLQSVLQESQIEEFNNMVEEKGLGEGIEVSDQQVLWSSPECLGFDQFIDLMFDFVESRGDNHIQGDK